MSQEDTPLVIDDPLYYFMLAWEDIFTDDDTPDGAWWRTLEMAVEDWNQEMVTNYDSNDMVQAYLERKSNGHS